MATVHSNIAHFPSPIESERPAQQDLNKLASLLDRYAPHDGHFSLTEDGVQAIKTSSMSAEVTCVVSNPGICIVAQGAKATFLSNNTIEYDENNLIVYSAEVPIRYRIIKATEEEPYLCMAIPIDPQKLGELILKVFPDGVPKCKSPNAIYVGESDAKIVKAAIRLMELIRKQEEVDLLVPLVIEEIFIRLLRSPIGVSVAQIGIADSHAQKVAKATSWLKNNYAERMKIDDLANVAGMSVSAFHSYFKEITSMTPLQYQKALRLQEARKLMMSRMMDVSRAGLEVGYASTSQFSREYRRHFGVPPGKDLGRLS